MLEADGGFLHRVLGVAIERDLLQPWVLGVLTAREVLSLETLFIEGFSS